jgi:hypothetical protein
MAQAVAGNLKKNFLQENALAGFNIDLTQDNQNSSDISIDEKGVIIIRVEPYSAAEDAGLKKVINWKSTKEYKIYRTLITLFQRKRECLAFYSLTEAATDLHT